MMEMGYKLMSGCWGSQTSQGSVGKSPLRSPASPLTSRPSSDCPWLMQIESSPISQTLTIVQAQH